MKRLTVELVGDVAIFAVEIAVAGERRVETKEKSRVAGCATQATEIETVLRITADKLSLRQAIFYRDNRIRNPSTAR